MLVIFMLVTQFLPQFPLLDAKMMQTQNTFSLQSVACLSDTTGVQSQYGATWKHSMTLTANSSFASGTPMADGWKGVRVGREEELGLTIKGVRGAGEARASMPQGLVSAVTKDSKAATKTRWRSPD